VALLDAAAALEGLDGGGGSRLQDRRPCRDLPRQATAAPRRDQARSADRRSDQDLASTPRLLCLREAQPAGAGGPPTRPSTTTEGGGTMTTTAPSESELRERLTKEGMTLRKDPRATPGRA
jgi:hypothetical protein